MNRRWIIIIDNYNDIEKRAINLLYAQISDKLSYVLPIKNAHDITEEELKSHNIIIVGKARDNRLIEEIENKNIIQNPQKCEGYAIYVGNSIYNAENQMIVINGFDSSGVLYGCMDFCNKYLGDVAFKNKNIWNDDTYDSIFDNKLNKWCISSSPVIKRRAIWTWGHVIYDYREFFENMAKLRLNEIVIWNDIAPINAKDVVEYAHSLNIKVIWGFAWGWDTKLNNILKNYDQNTLKEIKQKVLETYKNQYLDTKADGIYFQSFTELNEESVNGKCVAQLVTELVNDIAGSLFNLYPDLHIQFGLHATSVKNKLEYIKNVDKRIYIVWEDCGSFPFEYYADKTIDFESTLKFTENTLALRGNDEKWGAVLKGMLKLDWTKFEHLTEPFILGQRTNNFIKARQINKNRIWKLQQASWLKNAEYFKRIIKPIAEKNGDCIVQALVEDAMLENEIMLPVALYADILWDNSRDVTETIEQVSKYPCVQYANI